MYKKFMKYINKIVEKIRNKELLKYILWKSGFNSALKKIVTFRHSKISELDYRVDNIENISQVIYENYGFDGRMSEIFSNNKKKVVHKWLHYLPIYEKYFDSYVGKDVHFLEIGVYKGGSMQMFRKYFGNEALIFGIDIDINCMKYDGVDGNVRIGNQSDKNFLDSVITEMKYVDIVLDDGSHNMKDIKNSFLHIFPKLKDGGIYMIEDLHTSYWRNYGGGIKNNNNFFNFLRELIDDIHHWYHEQSLKYPEVSKFIPAVHIYDSLVVFEKKLVEKPISTKVF